MQNQCSCSEISPVLEDMKLNIELLQSRTDALQSLANEQQVCSPITDCLRNIEILRQELSEERERTQKIEFDFKVFKGENLNVDGFGGQNCKSEYKVANKESPKRDETIPEFQCTEDPPEEISLIINNKPNYEADEYSLNAKYDKLSITPEFKCVEASLENSCLIVDTILNSESKPKTVRKQSFAGVPTLPKSIKGRSKSKPNFFLKQSFKPVSVTAPVSESTCIALHKPTKQTRETITQSKRPVWLSRLPLINGPEPLILNHTDNNLTRSRSHRTPFRKRPQKKLHPY